jgi:hypothetical protein
MLDSNSNFAFMRITPITFATMRAAKKAFVNFYGAGQLSPVRENRAGS